MAAGAAIINNTGKPSVQMAQLAKKYNAYLVIMFRGPFAASDIMAELKDFFAANVFTDIWMIQFGEFTIFLF